MSLRIRVYRKAKRSSPRRGAYAAVKTARGKWLAVLGSTLLLCIVGSWTLAQAGDEERPAGHLGERVANASLDSTETLASAPDLATNVDGAVREGRSMPAEEPSLPATLLSLAPGTSAAIVDLSSYRMFVYREEAGQAVKVTEYTVSIGENGGGKEREGDKRTPVGVYFVNSYIPGSRLPDLYGAGAFPVNYPNLWDRRVGRTGSGIWIHGTEKGVISRPRRSSRGCVTLKNTDFEVLYSQVAVGSSAIIFADQIRWQEASDVLARRREVSEAFDAWLRAWADLDTERYLSFYDPAFRSGKRDLADWSAHKRRVNAQKTFARITVDHVGIFGYPGQPDLVLVDFEQDYQSSNFNSFTRKRQYWSKTPSGWRILHEDAITRR